MTPFFKKAVLLDLLAIKYFLFALIVKDSQNMWVNAATIIVIIISLLDLRTTNKQLKSEDK